MGGDRVHPRRRRVSPSVRQGCRYPRQKKSVPRGNDDLHDRVGILRLRAFGADAHRAQGAAGDRRLDDLLHRGRDRDLHRSRRRTGKGARPDDGGGLRRSFGRSRRRRDSHPAFRLAERLSRHRAVRARRDRARRMEARRGMGGGEGREVRFSRRPDQRPVSRR